MILLRSPTEDLVEPTMNYATLFAAIVMVQFFVPSAMADEVDEFVGLFNQGKVEAIKKKTRGFVDPRILDSHEQLVKPVKIVTRTNVQKAIDSFYDDVAAEAARKGKKPREADLRDLRTYQAKLKIAWKQTFEAAKKAGVGVKAARYGIKRPIDPQIGVMVFFTSGDEIVMVTLLDEIAEEVDVSSGKIRDAQAMDRLLRFFKQRIRQGDSEDAGEPRR
ncbi:MAG: hypothetical protein OER86_06115 [Phycisphaerae bacterium]|nr:hypothetical protein [Phycisphaerae bacterium]